MDVLNQWIVYGEGGSHIPSTENQTLYTIQHEYNMCILQ